MIDTVILMFLAVLSWLGWLVGMLKPRAQFWVKFAGPIGLVWMTWYFIVALTRSTPQLIAGNMEAGQLTVAFMVGGVWALLANPRPKPPQDRHADDTHGARHA